MTVQQVRLQGWKASNLVKAAGLSTLKAAPKALGDQGTGAQWREFANPGGGAGGREWRGWGGGEGGVRG